LEEEIVDGDGGMIQSDADLVNRWDNKEHRFIEKPHVWMAHPICTFFHQKKGIGHPDNIQMSMLSQQQQQFIYAHTTTTATIIITTLHTIH